MLTLLFTLGILLLISSKDLILFYLSIELLSLSFYILATIDRTGSYSTEAGLKYFLLGALSSGLLLLGISLIYKETACTDYTNLYYVITSGEILSSNSIISIGSLFIIISVLFKLAAAPFHM